MDSNSYPDLEVQNDEICHRGACHANHKECGICKIHYELVRDLLERNMLQYERGNPYEIVEVYRIDNPNVKNNFEIQKAEFFNSTQHKIQSRAELSVRARNHFREYFFRTSLTGRHIRDDELYDYICQGMNPTCQIPAQLQNFIRKFLKTELFTVFHHITFEQLWVFINRYFRTSLIQFLPTNINEIGFRTLDIDQCFQIFNLGFNENKSALEEELKNLGYEKKSTISQKLSWRALVNNLKQDIEENPETLLKFMNNRPSDAHEVRWAWHGTQPENISTIASDNFNPAYMKRQVHGKGFYFSPNPNVAIQYAKPLQVQNEKHHALLLCQVCLGHTAPSKRNNGDSNTYKDFCYAVPNINQINPRYVVTVKKRYQERRRRKH